MSRNCPMISRRDRPHRAGISSAHLMGFLSRSWILVHLWILFFAGGISRLKNKDARGTCSFLGRVRPHLVESTTSRIVKLSSTGSVSTEVSDDLGTPSVVLHFLWTSDRTWIDHDDDVLLRTRRATVTTEDLKMCGETGQSDAK